MDQLNKSYSSHESHYDDLIKNQRDRRLAELRNHDCANYIMNVGTLQPLSPLLKNQNTWLTIGDYNGFEAQYFAEHGQDVTASDISDTFLVEAAKEGYISKFQKLNVERIDHQDNTFDYVSCREAYHHFPRAFYGMYEMIRVAKKAAILIEPVDAFFEMPIMVALKKFCDLFNPMLINKFWKNRFSWETVGNYVFKLSAREVEKVAMGMGLPCLALKMMNHRLKPSPKSWGDPAAEPADQKFLKKYNSSMKRWNLLCKLWLIPYNTICAIIFKEMPSDTVKKDLESQGWTVMDLPKNPYL